MLLPDGVPTLGGDAAVAIPLLSRCWVNINIDTSKPSQKKWRPVSDWRFMLLMACVIPLAGLLGSGQNPLSMNPYALVGSFLPAVLICGTIYLFNKR